MESNWLVTICALTLNTILCLDQFVVQQIELRGGVIAPRGSLIPGTQQKFLHWQDFATQTWGDLTGLAWIWVGFCHLYYYDQVPWALFGITTLVGSAGFAYMCTRPNHKPDWGYPSAGLISIGGLLHLFYFGASLAAAMSCLMKIVAGVLTGMPMTLTIAGGMIWLTAAAIDMTVGNFDPLKRIE